MKTRIHIGIPAYNVMNTLTVNSLLWLVSRNDYEFTFSIKTGACLIKNRTDIVKEAQGSDYLLMVDSDMVFGEDLLKRLIACDKDIVGVDSSLKQIPRQTTVKYEGEMPKELFKCNGVGTGIILIKTKCLDFIAKPLFKFEYEDGNIITGEDIWFCRQAIKSGIDIWCDPTLEIKHIGDYHY